RTPTGRRSAGEVRRLPLIDGAREQYWFASPSCRAGAWGVNHTRVSLNTDCDYATPTPAHRWLPCVAAGWECLEAWSDGAERAKPDSSAAYVDRLGGARRANVRCVRCAPGQFRWYDPAKKSGIPRRRDAPDHRP